VLFDALKAETYRILRNRMTILFSVVLVPLLFAVGSIAYHIISESRGGELAAKLGVNIASSQPLNIAEAFMMAADKGANGAVLVFMLIAAATVYAGDYRWETWRLISARNDRTSLILGKVGTMKVLALATMGLFLIASIVYLVAQATIYERPMSFSLGAAEAGDAVVLAVLSFIRIIQFGLVALLTAVLTRSLLASLFVPWVLGFGQSILGQIPVMMLLGLKPSDWTSQLILPGLAYDTLKGMVVPGITSIPGVENAMLPALSGLALWTIAPLALAILWFRRQDLSKE
jgi:ABC-2 type transport system permease protein